MAPFFEFSHSHSLALCAVACEHELGIDLEYVREELDIEGIAQHVCSPGEIDKLRKLPVSDRAKAFFNCWTRKEALLKAIGKGLSVPMDRFEVSFAPDEPTALLGAGDMDASSWSLRELSPGPGYVAAIAFEGTACRVSQWQWTTDGW